MENIEKVVTAIPATIEAIREWLEEIPEDRWGEEEKVFEQGEEAFYVRKSYKTADERILAETDPRGNYYETERVLDRAEVEGIEAYSGEDTATVSNVNEILNLKY